MIHFSLEKKLSSASGAMHLDVDCKIESGNFSVIYGKSGAGKTSILRMLAGLLAPEKGYIEVNGQVWLDSQKGIDLKPQKRKIAYVFQDYALFPNMTVRQNLLYALDQKKDQHLVDELIEITELNHLQNRKPTTLSGGQQQRVALARALIRKPDLLLLDEPLSALDEATRHKLQDYILKIHKEYALTSILVSHDMSEIFKMAQKIFVLHQGRVQETGSPNEVFTRHQISGKFRFVGTIVHIQKNEVVYIISVLIGSQIIKAIATEEEAQSMQLNDKVMVVSKAFNPLLIKLENL